MSFLCNIFEGFMLFFPFDMTYPNSVESMKEMPVHFPKHKNCHWNIYFLLKFHNRL